MDIYTCISQYRFEIDDGCDLRDRPIDTYSARIRECSHVDICSGEEYVFVPEEVATRDDDPLFLLF
jgi:hypothetical protein